MNGFTGHCTVGIGMVDSCATSTNNGTLLACVPLLLTLPLSFAFVLPSVRSSLRLSAYFLIPRVCSDLGCGHWWRLLVSPHVIKNSNAIDTTSSIVTPRLHSLRASVLASAYMLGSALRSHQTSTPVLTRTRSRMRNSHQSSEDFIWSYRILYVSVRCYLILYYFMRIY